MKKFYGIFIMLIVVQFSFAQKVTVPQLKSPENEYEFAMPNAILDWDAVSGVGEITYHVQLATDDAFTDLIVDQEATSISAYYNEYLLFGNQYYWRVKSSDDIGVSEWSETYTFTVFSEGQNKKPKDGSDNVDILPRFQWKKTIDGNTPTGIDGFDIEVDTSANFDSPLSRIYTSGYEDGDLMFELKADYLMFGTVYYWHLRPMHAQDAGTWTETWSFETALGVELKTPGNNESNIEFDEKLQWSKLDSDTNNIFEFTCQISLDEAFTDPVSLITKYTYVQPDFYKFGTEYFWRVKAAHPYDVSPWSEVRSFSTVGSIELKSPNNGQALNTYRPVLKWTNIASVSGYELRLSKNSDNSDAEYFVIPGASSNNYPLNTLDASMYYWSVRAFNGNDTSAWADNYSFSTLNVGINELGNISNLSVFPNPATNDVNIGFLVLQNADLTITISDILGKTMVEETVEVVSGEFRKSFDISKYDSGIYFLEIKNGESNIVKKFVVK